MNTVFAHMQMGTKAFDTWVTPQGKALPAGHYVLIAVPVQEQARLDALAHEASGKPDGAVHTPNPIYAQHFWAALMDIRGETSA